MGSPRRTSDPIKKRKFLINFSKNSPVPLRVPVWVPFGRFRGSKNGLTGDRMQAHFMPSNSKTAPGGKTRQRGACAAIYGGNKKAPPDLAGQKRTGPHGAGCIKSNIQYTRCQRSRHAHGRPRARQGSPTIYAALRRIWPGW